MACKNGHDTINEINNCFTCGEPNEAEGNAPTAPAPVVHSKVSLSTLQRMRKEISYFDEAIQQAISEIEKE